MIDVQRTPWFDAFFSAWSFEQPEELLAAVRTTSLDLGAMLPNRDLTGQGLSGWTYWYLYLKGYTQFIDGGTVEDSNIYYRYLTEYFEQDEGLASVLRDREAARIRVERRYADFEALATSTEGQPVFEPITIWTQDPPPVDAKLVFVDGSQAPLPAVDIDGYHRLFAARLHGLEWVPAEVVTVGTTGAQREILKRIREIVRFTLPYNAKVAVAVAGEDGEEEPPDLEGRAAQQFTLSKDGDADGLRAALDAAVAENCQYALIPAALVDRAERAGVLDLGLRLLSQDRESCYVISLVTEDPGAAEIEQAEDLSLPPQEMRLLSSGTAEPERFVASGRTGIEWLRGTFARHGASLDDGAILEFGCGAGRYLRHLSQHSGPLVGIDYNPYLLAWTEANLRFARFGVCGSRPPLPEPDDLFDAVYAVDVFSHLEDSAQVPWFDELARVLRPGGLMVITLHGAGRTENLPVGLRRTFGEGRLAVLRPTLSGTNGCAAYHPRAYVERVFGRRLPLIEHSEQAAKELRQDVAVFRKPDQ